MLTPTKMTVIVHQEEDHNDDKLSRQILRKGMLLKKNGEKKKDCKPEHYGRRFFVIDGSGTVSYYRDEHGYRKQHAPASSFSCIGLQIVEDAGRLEDGSVRLLGSASVVPSNLLFDYGRVLMALQHQLASGPVSLKGGVVWLKSIRDSEFG